MFLHQVSAFAAGWCDSCVGRESLGSNYGVKNLQAFYIKNIQQQLCIISYMHIQDVQVHVWISHHELIQYWSVVLQRIEGQQGKMMYSKRHFLTSKSQALSVTCFDNPWGSEVGHSI